MIVGHDSEMSQIEELLRACKHTLVVVGSKPRMGRSAFLEEVRSRAINLNWRVLPSVFSSEEPSPSTIEINRNTTKNDFLSMVSHALQATIRADESRIQSTSAFPALSVPGGARGESETVGVSPVFAQSGLPLQPSGIPQDALSAGDNVLLPSGKPKPKSGAAKVLVGTLILIASYQPDKEFETWFSKSYIPETSHTTSPVVIVVAGYSSDLSALAEKADLRIELGPVPIQATIEYFRGLNDDVVAKMDETEIQAYANASAKAPHLIDTLTRLLKLG